MWPQEVQAARSSGCPRADRPPRVRGPSQAGGWPVVTRSVRASPLRAPRATDVPHPAAGPRDLLAWQENTGCCGQADTAAVCPGVGAPVRRELTDRTVCRLPALFQNSLGSGRLRWPGGRLRWPGPGSQQQGRGAQGAGRDQQVRAEGSGPREGRGDDSVSVLGAKGKTKLTCLRVFRLRQPCRGSGGLSES